MLLSIQYNNNKIKSKIIIKPIQHFNRAAPWLIHKKVMTHSSSSSIEEPCSSSLSSDFARSLTFSDLTPLSPEVIQRQATVNIGTIGHVAHGKSTVVKAISGVQTVRFKNELERNITIKLGYANAKVKYFYLTSVIGIYIY